MFTNTYLPHVGGVARSVKTLEDECRKLGHEVCVVAPQADHAEESRDVLRVPAIQNFNGSDFSFRLPAPLIIRDFIEEFQPDVIHSHHPFLLGDSALREAWKARIPIVFTHHTLYERYTHYVPMDSPALKRVAIQLATEYCNLCSEIIAPSESIAKLLKERGVTTPISAIPTGIDTEEFARANGAEFRKKHGIPEDCILIGHVGRLAEEKNLHYLVEAVKAELVKSENVRFLLVGDGPEKEKLLQTLEDCRERVIAPGSLQGSDLCNAYAAMDLFVFASQSETQGMVLAEAMAAGVPVVSLDGAGVREIVDHENNGLMLAGDADVLTFGAAIRSLVDGHDLRHRCAEGAKQTAADYDRKATTLRITGLYESLIAQARFERAEDFTPWDRLLNGIGIEWDLTVAKFSAMAAIVSETPATEATLD